MALSKKKKIIIGVSALVVLALVVIISVLATRKDEPEVTTVKVDVRQELKSTVTASGEVRPVRYIKLTSEVPGRIEEIYVNPGDQVGTNTAAFNVLDVLGDGVNPRANPAAIRFQLGFAGASRPDAAAQARQRPGRGRGPGVLCQRRRRGGRGGLRAEPGRREGAQRRVGGEGRPLLCLGYGA